MVTNNQQTNKQLTRIKNNFRLPVFLYQVSKIRSLGLHVASAREDWFSSLKVYTKLKITGGD